MDLKEASPEREDQERYQHNEIKDSQSKDIDSEIINQADKEKVSERDDYLRGTEENDSQKLDASQEISYNEGLAQKGTTYLVNESTVDQLENEESINDVDALTSNGDVTINQSDDEGDEIKSHSSNGNNNDDYGASGKSGVAEVTLVDISSSARVDNRVSREVSSTGSATNKPTIDNQSASNAITFTQGHISDIDGPSRKDTGVMANTETPQNNTLDATISLIPSSQASSNVVEEQFPTSTNMSAKVSSPVENSKSMETSNKDNANNSNGDLQTNKISSPSIVQLANETKEVEIDAAVTNGKRM